MLVLALPWALAALPAQADERGKAQRHSPIQLRSSSTYRPPAGVPQNLTPPAGLGSASNVGPNFYRQLDAPRPTPGTGQGNGSSPGIVYVVPGGFFPHGIVTTPYAVGPVEVGVEPVPDERRRTETERIPRQRPPAEQPPIVIINNPPAAERERAPPTPSLRSSPPARPPAPRAPRPTAPMDVELSVTPDDARVYLDDELLGDGAQLATLEEPMRLDPGVYVVEVTHPDHAPQRIVFGVGSKPLEILVDLEAETPRRRSRVRQ